MPETEALERAARRHAAAEVADAAKTRNAPLGAQAIADTAAVEDRRRARGDGEFVNARVGRQAIVDAERLASQESVAAGADVPAFLKDIPEGFVRCRILPKGHKKVATGGLNPNSLSNKFPFHRRGDHLALPLEVALAQEANGHLEITDPIDRPDEADED